MLKRIVAILLFLLGIVSFGEVPHSYIWENPDREVTQIETLKRHKDKAELNITVTKLKSESIPMKHNVEGKKIYFELTSNEVKRSDGSIRLEPTDRIFVSERLEEVPSVSTTNGRKKINGLKRLNKSLDKGTIKSGNLTWTVKDLRTAETKKLVEINYEMFPKSLYVGITDRDYNLKKIFVGKMEDLELYSAEELAGYVHTYSIDPYISTKYEGDISDLVIWNKDKTEVDVKFLEGNILSISNTEETGKNLISKNPYLKVKGNNGTQVTLNREGGSETITGTIHIINTSESSTLSRIRTESLKDKIGVNLDFTGEATEELNTAIYIRFNGEEYKKLIDGTYKVQSGAGLVYGYNNGTNESEVINLPNLIIENNTIGESKKVTVDLWLFDNDFTDKVNYVLDPRNNGTGNLKIRAQDENTYVTSAVSAGATDSVFDIQGKIAKFDYEDGVTEVRVENIKGFTSNQQDQGSFDRYKNKWAGGSIPGYNIKARIWSDYDGLELDFEKVGTQDESNEGVYSFKIIQRDTRYNKTIQEITVNLYVNNLLPSERADKFNTKYTALRFENETAENYFNEIIDGKKVKTMGTKDGGINYHNEGIPFRISMITKSGDLEHYFPLFGNGVILHRKGDVTAGVEKLVLNRKNFDTNKVKDIITKGKKVDDEYYTGEANGNKGLYTLELAHELQIPIEAVKGNTRQNFKYETEDTYTYYGKRKRKFLSLYTVGVQAKKDESSTYYQYSIKIKGVPLLSTLENEKNIFYGEELYESLSSNNLVTDNVGWYEGRTGNLPLHARARLFINNIDTQKDNPILKDNMHQNHSEYRVYKSEKDNLIFGSKSNIYDSKQMYVYIGVGIKKWKMNKTGYKLGSMRVTASGALGYDYDGKNLYQDTETIITVDPFDAIFMLDKTQSSIKEDILTYVDLDTRENSEPTNQVIEIGEVYFKNLDIEALKQNTDQKAKILLPNSAYLVEKGSSETSGIAVDLSFSQTDSSQKTFEMAESSIENAGGNGSKVYLHIDGENYKKLINNGAGKEYQVKGNYSSGTIESSVKENQEGVVQIGVVATKSPFNDRSTNEYFFKPIVTNLEVRTREVQPIAYKVTYNSNIPLIAGHEIAIIDNKIQYLTTPNSKSNYSTGISLTGNVTPYDFSQKAHSYQVTDNSGSIRNGQIGSGGSGAYWENLSVGGGDVSLERKRTDEKITVGGQEYSIREVTFFKLQNYNYEKSSGKIIEKHYKPYSKTINQYYELTVELPDFDPYIYYDKKSIDSKLSPIDIGADLEVNRVEGTRVYPLGTVATHDYNVDITKKDSGNLADTYGLRIVPNNRNSNQGVILYELKEDGTKGEAYSTRGRIIFIDESGNEIAYNINSPSYMLGGNQSIRVALELPADLPTDKDYIIQGDSTKNILDKNKDIPDNFNLIIGRNRYFKELIKSITIRNSNKIEGKFTLTFTNDYNIGDMAKFNSRTLTDRADMAFENPTIDGVKLSDSGTSFLHLENGDKFQIINNSKITELNIDNDLTLDKQEVLLSDGVTKLAVKVENGKIQLGLNYWKPSTEETVTFKVIRENVEVMSQVMTLNTPTSQFIVTHRENLDFGSVIQGTNNNYAEASLEILNTGSDIANLTFKISESDRSPELIKVGDKNQKLTVKEVNGALFKKEDKLYEMRVNGYLDVPEEQSTGDYRGRITIELYIK